MSAGSKLCGKGMVSTQRLDLHNDQSLDRVKHSFVTEVHPGILPERVRNLIPISQTGFSFRRALNKLGPIRRLWVQINSSKHPLTHSGHFPACLAEKVLQMLAEHWRESAVERHVQAKAGCRSHESAYVECRLSFSLKRHFGPQIFHGKCPRNLRGRLFLDSWHRYGLGRDSRPDNPLVRPTHEAESGALSGTETPG